ncbi:MAG: hypothetical protein H6643_16780 [Caldilineaceae bacterium]|nr:hypothetical protein [Caldilineaceae bacterium]
MFVERSHGWGRRKSVDERAEAARRTQRRKEETKQAALEAKRQAHWYNRAARFLSRFVEDLRV